MSSIIGDFIRLVDHYRGYRRDLPWRGAVDPYVVLVSEVMLQQTRVETVVPYYLKFVQSFPDLQALADAPVEEVLAAWAGLGYYRRARALHQAARELLSRGAFPTDPDDLQRLPGIGEYTAAALASIAFGRPAVALDGNALRVFTRYFGIAEDVETAKLRADIRQRVLPNIPAHQASEFTQGVMELGARICTARNPICKSCPLARGCLAFSEGRPEAYPVRRPRRASRAVVTVAARVEDSDRFYLVQARDGEQLTGLWLCPWVELEPGLDATGALNDELARHGRFILGPGIGEVRHSITFRRIRCQVYQAGLARDQVSERHEGLGKWFHRDELGKVPLPAFVTRILRLGGG